MNRQITPLSSLVGLKKEAKRWLKALRDGNAEALARLSRITPHAPDAPGMRDIQHALALEHGVKGWMELTRLLSETAHTEPVQPTMPQYEEMAEALLDAFLTGAPEAMERHWKLTWHRRAWAAMRTYVLLDLGRRPDDASQAADISLADAQFLVAKEHGFESWAALAEFVAALPAGGVTVAAKPVRLFSIDANGERRTLVQSRDWETVLGTMRDQRISGLDANGEMTDALLDRVSRINGITSLDLNGSSQVMDAGLRFLARMTQLQQLDLSSTGITDGGLAVLRQLKELKSIRLCRTGITDVGIAFLADCERLEKVDLSWTRTGDSAIAALTGKDKLSHFMSGTEVTDAGIAHFHQYPVFKTWQGGDIRMGLLEYTAGPNYLSLRGSFTDRGLADLAGLDGLFALNLDDGKLAVTAPGLASLVTLPNLGWLALDAADESMRYLAAMANLRFLMCQDTSAGDDGFVALSRSNSIEKIWGRRCYNLMARGFTALSQVPALRALSVSCKNVEDAGLSSLPRFPALTELMPMDVLDEGFRHIGRCEKLESLALMYCRETTDRATETIVGLDRLKKYFASYNLITDRTPEILSGISSLEEVDFSACAGLTNKGIAALARLPRLRELRLGGMQHVTADVASAFPAQVRVEHSL